MFEQRGNVFKGYYKITSLHTFITVVITVCTYVPDCPGRRVFIAYSSIYLQQLVQCQKQKYLLRENLRYKVMA